MDPRVPVEIPYLTPHKLVSYCRRRSHSAGEEDMHYVKVSIEIIQSINFSRSSLQLICRIIFFNLQKKFSFDIFIFQAPQVPPRPFCCGVGQPLLSRALPQPEIPTAYNDKVVAFLRQPNIMDILKERYAPLGNCHQGSCHGHSCCQVSGKLGLKIKVLV